jgi:chromosome segregation ATPase
MINQTAALFLLLASLLAGVVNAAPREGGGSGKAVAKLQAMVRDITSERDALKTERDAIIAEKEKLTAEIDKYKKEQAASAVAESRLSSELNTAKTNNEAMTGRLDKTNAKLLEVIEKYNALNQQKNELTANHGSLEDLQRQTKTELQSCEGKNIKMYEATKALLKSYEKKDVFDTLLKSEPVLQLKTVEMETIIQEYEDKLRKQKYQHKEITVTKNEAPGTEDNVASEVEENNPEAAEKPPVTK